MTTDEEKMQEYLRSSRQRDAKKKSTTKKSSPKNEDDDDEPSVMTPTSYYVRHVIFFLIRAAMVCFAIMALVSIAYSAMFDTRDDSKVVYLLYVAIALYAVPVLWKVFDAIRYSQWVKGGLYPFKGWTEFLALRSEDFSKGNRYTRIRIVVRLTPDATQTHQQVTAAFMKDFVESKFGIRYSKMEWEPGSSVPKDFTADKNSLSGDISMRSLRLLVKKMSYDMTRLSSMLGNALQLVEMESDSIERKCETVRVSRSDD